MNLVMLQAVLTSIVSAVIVFGFIYIMKKVTDKLVSAHYNADEQIRNGNMAISLRRIGLYTGTAIALFSTINGFTMQIIDGATVVVFMLIAMIISEKIIYPNFDNIVALKEGNLGIGFSEAGLYIGTGIIASASFSGNGPWFSSILFFILGQIILVGAVKINERNHPGTINGVKEGNKSAGIMLGGITIAYALILKGAISGPFNGWMVDIQSFFISAIIGGLLLLIFANKVIERVFFYGKSIKEELKKDNVSVISIVVGIKIAIALTISGVIF